MSERMVKNLCEMVSISSESGEEKEFIEFLKTKLQQEFNGRCQVDSYGNLICKIPHVIDGGSKLKTCTL